MKRAFELSVISKPSYFFCKKTTFVRRKFPWIQSTYGNDFIYLYKSKKERFFVSELQKGEYSVSCALFEGVRAA